MAIGQLIIEGRRYMIVEESEYSRLLIASTGAVSVREKDLPALPGPDVNGNVPAMQYARVSLARKLIVQRKARGWSQAELGRRAGVRVETINRLEKARHTADPETVRKIEASLEMRQHRARSSRKAG